MLSQLDASSSSPEALRAYGTVLSIGSSHAREISTLASNVMALFPNPLRSLLDKWDRSSYDFPNTTAWVSKRLVTSRDSFTSHH